MLPISNVGRGRSTSSKKLMSTQNQAANSNAMSSPNNIMSTSSRNMVRPMLLPPTMQHGSESTSMCGPMPWQLAVQHGGMAGGSPSKHGSAGTVPWAKCAPTMLYGSDAHRFPCGPLNVGEEEGEEGHVGNGISLLPVKVVEGTMEGGKGSLEKEEEPAQKKKKTSLFSKFKRTMKEMVCYGSPTVVDAFLFSSPWRGTPPPGRHPGAGPLLGDDTPQIYTEDRTATLVSVVEKESPLAEVYYN
eukprot:gene28450-31595_t